MENFIIDETEQLVPKASMHDETMPKLKGNNLKDSPFKTDSTNQHRLETSEDNIEIKTNKARNRLSHADDTEPLLPETHNEIKINDKYDQNDGFSVWAKIDPEHSCLPVKTFNVTDQLVHGPETFDSMSQGCNNQIEGCESGLDDVDGAMFSRIRVEDSKNDNFDIQGSMFNRTRRRESDGSLDSVDGAMFSRQSASFVDKYKPGRKLTLPKFWEKRSDIPKSPSADFLNNIGNSNISTGFPFKPFSSAGNLAKQDRPTSAFSDCTDSDFPSDFDIGNHGTNKPINENTQNMKGDDSDSALFNRDNSFRKKLIANQRTVKDCDGNEVIPNNILQSSKSLNNIHNVDNTMASTEDLSKVRDCHKQSSVSLPNYVASIHLDPNFKTTLTSLKFPTDKIPGAEEIITKQKFIPLEGKPRQNNSSTSIVSVIDEDVKNSLLRTTSERVARAPFKWKYLLSVMFPTISVVLFLADIVSDVNLALRYRREGDNLFYYVTLMCIIVPSLLMSVVDVSWVYIDRKSLCVREGEENYCYNTRCWKVFRYSIGILSFGRIVRTISHIYHSIRSKMYPGKKEHHKTRKIEERRDYCMLDVINAFTESCPQLIAQMFLLYRYSKPFSLDLGFSIFSSWVSIGWAYSCYYRYQKEALSGKKELNLGSVFLFFFAVLSALATRVCCISLFLAYYPWWIGAIIVLVHFVLMFVWIAFCQKPDLEGLTSSKLGQYLYYLFFAYLSIMYFVNLKANRTRFRILVYFIIYNLENCAAAACLLYKTSFDYRKSVTEFRWSLVIVPLGLVMHLILLVLFYYCLHPKAKRVRKSKNVPI